MKLYVLSVLGLLLIFQTIFALPSFGEVVSRVKQVDKTIVDAKQKVNDAQKKVSDAYNQAKELVKGKDSDPSTATPEVAACIKRLHCDPALYNPVCGSNMKTYNNTCFLTIDQACLNINVTLEAKNPCNAKRKSTPAERRRTNVFLAFTVLTLLLFPVAVFLVIVVIKRGGLKNSDGETINLCACFKGLSLSFGGRGSGGGGNGSNEADFVGLTDNRSTATRHNAWLDNDNDSDDEAILNDNDDDDDAMIRM